MLFGNIFAQRVLSRLIRAVFLNSYLSFARKEPINENLGGIGMGRFVDQGNHRSAGFEGNAVLVKHMGVKNIHRQALIFRFFDFGRFGGERERKFTRGNPVGLQPVVAHERRRGGAEKFFKIFRAELRVVKQKEQRTVAAGLLVDL